MYPSWINASFYNECMPRRRRRHGRRLSNPNIAVLPNGPEPAREVEASGQNLRIRVLNPPVQNHQQAKPTNHQQEPKVKVPEKVTTTNDDDDVVYLYSVSKKSQVVEMVDLGEEGTEEPKEGARKFIASGQDFPIEIDSNATAVLKDLGNREISVTCKAGISIAIGGNPVSTAPILSRKRKRSPSSPHDTCCSICHADYELVTSSGNELFHARCGHLFCKQCIKTLSSCIQCNSKIANLWKIYL